MHESCTTRSDQIKPLCVDLEVKTYRERSAFVMRASCCVMMIGLMMAAGPVQGASGRLA